MTLAEDEERVLKRNACIDEHLERLAGWRKMYLWGLPGTAAADKPRVRDAVLSYLCRCLSRGIIPDANLVAATFNGQEVPACGYLGCQMEGEHVH